MKCWSRKQKLRRTETHSLEEWKEHLDGKILIPQPMGTLKNLYTPASGFCFAHLIARNESHDVSRLLRLDRFERGFEIDESGKGPQPNLH